MSGESGTPAFMQDATEAAGEAAEAAENAAEAAEESSSAGLGDRLANALNVKLPEPFTREVPDIEPEQIQERFGCSLHTAYVIRAVSGLVRINPLNSGAGSKTVIADLGRAGFSYLRMRLAIIRAQAEDSDSADGDTDDSEGEANDREGEPNSETLSQGNGPAMGD